MKGFIVKTTVALMILVSMVLASQATAVICQDPDRMGLYFDLSADYICIESLNAYSQVPLYLIYSNPSYESISGFRAEIEMVGSGLFLPVIGPDPIIISENRVGFDVTYLEPEPTSETMLLATLTVLYFSGLMDFNLGDLNAPSTEFPRIQLVDGSWVETENCVGDNWVASIRYECYGIPTAPTSFSSLKALYR